MVELAGPPAVVVVVVVVTGTTIGLVTPGLPVEPVVPVVFVAAGVFCARSFGRKKMPSRMTMTITRIAIIHPIEDEPEFPSFGLGLLITVAIGEGRLSDSRVMRVLYEL